MKRLVCINCGKERQFNNKRESIENYQKRRPRCFDCRVIKNNTQFKKGESPWNKGRRYEQIEWEKHPAFTTGRTRYRQHFKRNGLSFVCVECGSDERINIHHIDFDRDNNTLENLQPLCPIHHQNLHKNWEKRLWRPIKKFA